MWGISRVKSRHYRKIVRNAIIKRKRKANEIDEGCKRFMEDAFTPSRYPPSLVPFYLLTYTPLLFYSNSNKVVKKKIDGEWEYHVIHWKTDTIKNMYERCCLQYPIVANCKVKYFAKFIPWYVRNKPNYSGLCWKHDLGIFFSTLLKTRRTQWHLDCECDCTFCFDCDHGKNPDEGQCHYGTCKRCMNSECPIEYTEDEQGKIEIKKN